MDAATIALVLATLGVGPDRLDRHDDGVVYSPQRNFRIPLSLRPAEREESDAVRLLVSDDRGNDWREHEQVSPETAAFDFHASEDGEYWFGVALVDLDGRQVPPTLEGIDPGLRVVVDTTAPELLVTPFHDERGRWGVRWEIDDANPVADSIRLAIWDEPAGSWRPIAIDEPTLGKAFFEKSSPVLLLQARVLDRAGHEAALEVEIIGEQFRHRRLERFALNGRGALAIPRAGKHDPNVRVAGFEEDARPSPETRPKDPSEPAAPPESTGPSLCDSRVIVVNYEMENDAPDGPAMVELWGTRDDGKTWSRIAIDHDQQSPIEASLTGDGKWGLRIFIASPTAGIAGPRPGSEPEVLVEVDSIAPSVAPIACRREPDGAITVSWTVDDENLPPDGVELLVRSTQSEQWKSVATNLPGTGSHRIEPTLDFPLAEPIVVRIEARDRAGHVGSGQATSPSPQ